MPKRTDLETILVVGSGPIVIGQACEFDYSGTQGVKALRQEGYRVVLVNSNPATIMTDPDMAEATYIEPLTPEVLERVIARERPQALLATLGGQTALNLAVALAERGALEKYGVELIGAKLDSIRKAEDRQIFHRCMQELGLDVPRSLAVSDLASAESAGRELGFPVIVRASFTLGGAGGGIVYHQGELLSKAQAALEMSPIHKILLEESILGWKEYELEVMRDRKDNFVVVCSIENVDPMGVHTGDSVTVAPVQTLSDRQYQEMRDDARKIVSAVGVETGGCNVQFAVDPGTGRRVVVEINPRVSRSSALASKATGFPIAKIAAKLAVGYTLDEIANDITKATPACFEPALDYVVTKVPRFAVEKFGEFALDTAMKSVGEVMAVGRTFKESLQKALRGLENGRKGFESARAASEEDLMKGLATPSSSRLEFVKAAFERGMSASEISKITGIDAWFLNQMEELARFEARLGREKITAELMQEAKRLGFSDEQIARARRTKAARARALRHELGVRPAFELIDTCAGEFESKTPYFYSTYAGAPSLAPAPSAPAKKTRASKSRRVVILGSGPNRIGQGIEFDYCCVQACQALREMGQESVMINCNPETVSTDYDTSDRLYFEPLTLEDVLEILDFEKPLGVVAQFGGQTPLNLARPLAEAGVRILGTQPKAIDLAEDRRLFGRVLKSLKLLAPRSGIAENPRQALAAARRIGYPVMVRPSYVLGGRAMEIVYDDASLKTLAAKALSASEHSSLLIDRFLADAAEIDVDAVSDGKDVFVAGVMEHIEEAGIHSGDSACTLPPHSLSPKVLDAVCRATRSLALKLGVRGLVNVQYAVKDGTLYVLEANPRASRTVPFVSKATGVPLAKIATAVLMGRPLRRLLSAKLLKAPPRLPYVATKEVVLPFIKFPGLDPRLGPEMKSTGEVMGLGPDFPSSFAKSQEASGMSLPKSGAVFLSVKDEDKPALVPVARELLRLGFSLIATRRTKEFLARHGIEAAPVAKIGEGKPDVADLIRQKAVSLVVNTPSGKRERADGFIIRRTALELDVPFITNIRSCQAALGAIAAAKATSAAGQDARPLQDYYRDLAPEIRAARAGRGMRVQRRPAAV